MLTVRGPNGEIELLRRGLLLCTIVVEGFSQTYYIRSREFSLTARDLQRAPS